MYLINAEKLVSFGHHSWHDFVSVAAKRANGPGAPGHGDSSIDGRDDFHGTRNMQEAVDLALNGWMDGAKRIAKKLDTLPATSEVLPDWMLDVAGSIVNVPAFITGEPECMWRMSECKRDEHRVAIVVSGVYSGSVTSHQAMNYAVAIAATVRALEASGINPAVYMITTTTGRGDEEHFGNDTAGYSIAVREFGEPLDLARIAFAFHPSFLRRIQFGWQEMNSEAIKIGWGRGPYGSVGSISKEVTDKLLGDIGYVALLPALNAISSQHEDKMIATIRDSVNATLASIK